MRAARRRLFHDGRVTEIRASIRVGVAKVTPTATARPFADAASMLWDLDPVNWLDAACRVAGRDLTAAEWHHYLPERKQFEVCGTRSGDAK